MSASEGATLREAGTGHERERRIPMSASEGY